MIKLAIINKEQAIMHQYFAGLIGVCVLLSVAFPVEALGRSQATRMAPVAQAQSEASSSDQEQRQEIESKIKQRQEEREAKLQERNARRCEVVKTRLDAHLDRINIRAELRNRRYQTIIDRLEVIALRLENNNQDASELRSMIVTLSGLVSEFETAYTGHGVAVQKASNTACAEGGLLRAAIGEAMSGLRQARTEAQAIRTYIVEDIRSYLQSLQADQSQLDSDTDSGSAAEEVQL